VTGTCYVVGDYATSDSNFGPLVERLTGGKWTAMVPEIPADAVTGKTFRVVLSAISCASKTHCVAVGSYRNTAANIVGLIEVLTGTTWTDTVAPLPTVTPSFASSLSTVTCTSVTWCVATGGYVDTAFTDTYAEGKWTPKLLPNPPSTSTETWETTTVYALTCVSTAHCAAVGYFEYKSEATVYEYFTLTETLSGTTWSYDPVTEPSGPKSAYLGAVSCPSSAFCVATGSFENATGFSYGLIETLATGTWSEALAKQPANAGSQGSGTEDSGVSDVSCPSATWCVVAGTYSDATPDAKAKGHGYTHAMFDTFSKGTWSAAEAPEPANAGTDATKDAQVFATAVSCAAAETCVAVGEYADSFSTGVGYTYPLIETLDATGWTALEGPEPADSGTDSSGLQDAELTSVTLSHGNVIADGWYVDDNGFFQGLLEDFSDQSPGVGGTTGGKTTGGKTSGGKTTGGGTHGGGTHGGGSSGGTGRAGYDMVGSDGGVFVFPTGQSGGFFGSLPGDHVSVSDIVGMVPTPSDDGYFLVGADGGVFAFGDAPFLGSLPGDHVSIGDIQGIVPTSDNRGYFLVGADGGVFAFGDAPFLGSLPGIGVHRSDIIGIAATPTDRGYWVVAADGTVYSFGSAVDFGSVVGSDSPVSGISATPDGHGYWVVTQDGGVFNFGDAGSFGSLPTIGVTPSKPVIGLVPTADQKGYWLIGSDGGIFAFGDAGFEGSLPQVGVDVSDIVGAVPTKG
jgi:uncharacterized membrane protein YgcG